MFEKFIKRAKSLIVKLGILVLFVTAFIAGAWLLDIFKDRYPKSKRDQIGFSGISETQLFRPTYLFRCLKLHYYWQGATKDSASTVDQYYKNKWHEFVRSGTLDPFHYALVEFEIQNNQIIFDKIYTFIPPYEDDTIVAIDTNVYFCWPKE